MAYFFTDFIRTQLTASSAFLNPGNIRVVLWRSAPSMDGGVSQYLGVRTVAELEAFPGWDQVAGIAGYPFATNVAVSIRTIGVNRYILFTLPFSFAALGEPVGVQALGIQYIGSLGGQTNPLIFVTNTPTGLFQNIYPADALTTLPDSTFPDATNQWMFSWADPVGGAQIAPIEGPLVMFKGPPPFEASNTQHIWLYPQRANMIANPSFALPGTGFWSSSGDIYRVADPEVGWVGEFAGDGFVNAESNIWPTLLGDHEDEDWTIQFLVKGIEGKKLKVGLVYWDRDYRSTGVDWGPETWTLQENWIHVKAQRRGYEAHKAMLRIESDGGFFAIDQVLVERGFLKDWPYFDGDTSYGAPDSYLWHGGSSRQGESYSMWYGNRRAVVGRLFATETNPDDPDDVITDEDIEKWGLVYQWVPAGVRVMSHIDVFYPEDLRAPVPPKPAGVIPYKSGPSDLNGVTNPWA